MFKQYKKTLITASLVTLLPIPVGLLLWNRFPEYAIIHWGWNGQPDGWGTIPTLILTTPLILLLTQWLCIWATAEDPGNKGRNRKPMTLVLWIIPLLSNLTSGMMYALALGVDFSPVSWMTAAIGLMFVVIGNYLPKCKMNSTIGIKIPWTYTSEANWNATHRFGGKVWVIGGIAIAFSGLLPGSWSITVMLLSMAILAIIPTVYSYRFYRRQLQQGDALLPLPRTSKTAWIALVILLILVGTLMFTGDLEYQFDDNYLTIDASYYSDLIIRYTDIESVEYRDSNVPGLRVGGFGSARLLMGYFQNNEFGIHTRYTYGKPEACLVVKTKGNTFVLSGESKAETETIFQELLLRTGK